MELDEDSMGFEDLAEGDEEAVGDFNKDVAAQEPRFSGVVNQAKAPPGMIGTIPSLENDPW